jgi:hypothetical protein
LQATASALVRECFGVALDEIFSLKLGHSFPSSSEENVRHQSHETKRNTGHISPTIHLRRIVGTPNVFSGFGFLTKNSPINSNTAPHYIEFTSSSQ